MEKISVWQRVKQVPRAMKSALESSWRGPFFGQSGYGDSGAWHQIGPLDTGWQRNLEPPRQAIEYHAPVYACVATLSQDAARVEIVHERTLDNGGREVVTNKAPARIFRRPNHYQTRMDWMLYLMRSLLLDGNAYCIATRNDRNEIDALHPVSPRQIWPYIADGEVFYRVGDNEVTELADINVDEWFPQRDVMHVRLFCPRHPLIGESPIKAALASTATGIQINNHTASFFANMSRPSGILRYPGKLGSTPQLQETAVKRIKERFMEITQGRNSGEPLVLQEDAQWTPLQLSAVESDLAATYNLSAEDIYRVFRVPQPLVGHLERATFQNVESLMRFYSGTLSFYCETFELTLQNLFNLPPNERIHYDVERSLLKADVESRANATAKFVQSGVYSPNEARVREGLPGVGEIGDEPRVQQQLVGLSYAANLKPGGGADPDPAPQPDPAPSEEERMAAAIIAKRAIEKAMLEETT